jgi:ParB-like chromosome segregation protein Spo0J
MPKKSAKIAQDQPSGVPISPEVTSDLSYIDERLRPLAVPVAELLLDPKNARKHDERNLAAIAASLRTYGIHKNVVVQQPGNIVRAGNGTVQAAIANGWSHVPAIFVKEDEASAVGFAIADNRTAELSDWDEDVLRELMSDLSLDGLDDELARMFGDLDAELKETLAAGDSTTHVNRGGSDPAETTGSPTTSAPIERVWKVLVTCKDENQQLELIQRLQNEGLDVKALIA